MISRLHLSFLLLLLLNGCVQKQTSYSVIGNPAISIEGKYMTCIVAESEGRTHQENGGYRKTNYSSSYWLKRYELATGKLLQKKKLIGQAELNNQDITCYGGYGDMIWIYAAGLQAYDINTLEEKVNEEIIIRNNSFPKDKFPYTERTINLFLAEGFASFTANSGQKYTLNLLDLKIETDDGSKKRRSKPDVPGATNIPSVHQTYALRSDTFKDRLYSFAKDSMAATRTYFGNTDISEKYYSMHLFTADYNVRRIANHNSFTYANFHQKGTTAYLNPGILKDELTGEAIHTDNPAGFLILHQDTVGSNAKTIITRIDLNHNKTWEGRTGISSKINRCIVAGRYCILTGNTDYMFSPPVGQDAICIIDIITGAITNPPLAK